MADLRKKIELIRRYINVLRETGARAAENNPNKPGLGAFTVLDKEWTGVSGHKPLMTLYRDWEKFDNRYFAHNPTIFLSNSTRDVLLKYYLLSRTRKGFAYHMTARAIKYIRDLSKSPKEERPRNHRSKGSQHSKAQSSEHEDGSNLLYGLLHDTMQYVMPESPNVDEWSPGSDSSAADEDPKDGISDEFSIRRTNVCVLLKPQIVLRSDIDEHSTVIITAIRARLQNYRVSDDTCPEDYVNSRVMYRNYLSLDSLQAFQPSKECRFLESARHGSGFVYVPLETFIDLRYETRDFDRIVPQTDATMHYDKFNKVRSIEKTFNGRSGI